MGRERSFGEVAELYNAGKIQGIVLIETTPLSRLEQLGIEPLYGEQARAELKASGIPDRAISTIHQDGGSDWQRARAIQAWLQANPNSMAVLPTNRFQSRRATSF